MKNENENAVFWRQCFWLKWKLWLQSPGLAELENVFSFIFRTFCRPQITPKDTQVTYSDRKNRLYYVTFPISGWLYHYNTTHTFFFPRRGGTTGPPSLFMQAWECYQLPWVACLFNTSNVKKLRFSSEHKSPLPGVFGCTLRPFQESHVLYMSQKKSLLKTANLHFSIKINGFLINNSWKLSPCP